MLNPPSASNHSLLGMHYTNGYVSFTGTFIPFRNKNQSSAMIFFSWISHCVKTTYKTRGSQDSELPDLSVFNYINLDI